MEKFRGVEEKKNSAKEFMERSRMAPAAHGSHLNKDVTGSS